MSLISPSLFQVQDQILGLPLLFIISYHLTGNECIFLDPSVPQIASLFYFQIAGSSAHQENWSFPFTPLCDSFEDDNVFFSISCFKQ